MTDIDNKTKQEEPTVTEETTTTTTPFVANSNFAIPIHSIINNAQQSHGVPHNDYQQYRSYLTRRLSRIRHAKPVIKTLSHGPRSKRDTITTTTTTTTTNDGGNITTTSSKNKSSSGGKGKHAFQARDELTIEKVSTHENYILDGLLSTERSWAHAMELKSYYEDLVDNNGNRGGGGGSGGAIGQKKKTSPGKVRQHYINKLKKAMTYVCNLEQTVTTSTGGNDSIGSIGGTGVCDYQTCLEIKCYSAWMKGNYYCEVHHWEDACQHYAIALKLCYQIAKSTKKSISVVDLASKAASASTPDGISSSTTTTTTTNTAAAETLQLSDFFHSRGTNIIQPLLRFCKYELLQEGKLSKEEIGALCDVSAFEDGNNNDDDDSDDDADDEFTNTRNTNDDNLSSITFRGKNVSVEETNIKMSLIKINTTKEELENMSLQISSSSNKKKKKVKASIQDSKFMELLNCYDDAVSIVLKNLKDYEGMASGPAVNKKRFDCTLLLGYFKYAKLQLLMKRNEKMVDGLRDGDQEMTSMLKKQQQSKGTQKSVGQEDADAKYKRVEEIAHLYDALLQDAKAVVCLPGGGEVEGDDAEDEFTLEANATVLRIRALRCYYVGRMYAADTVAKYSEALALFEQAALLASEAAEEIAACQEMELADELIESMADLQKEIVAVQVRTRASSFLASRGSEASSVTTGLTLLRRLDDFDSGGKSHRIVDVPPALEPIPCKPAFFDIANNYVNDFPMDELEFHSNAVKAKGSRGFMSWFRKS